MIFFVMLCMWCIVSVLILYLGIYFKLGFFSCMVDYMDYLMLLHYKMLMEKEVKWQKEANQSVIHRRIL